MLRKFISEPLTHFLLAGALLFVIVSLSQGLRDDDRTITVTEDDLLEYLQGRAQVYDEETFAELVDSMSADERQALILDVASQEALYREGLAISLPDVDPLVRLRTVQQMRLLLMEEAAANVSIGDRDIERHYDEHRDDYRVPPRITFTHVFVNAREGADRSTARARALLGELRASDVPATQSGRHGDRFLYQRNYADVSDRQVRSHFGDGFAAEVFELAPGEWSDPLASDHGWHLVFVTRKAGARLPELAEIAERVRDDALAAKREAAAREALESLLDEYEVVVAVDASQ